MKMQGPWHKFCVIAEREIYFYTFVNLAAVAAIPPGAHHEKSYVERSQTIVICIGESDELLARSP